MDPARELLTSMTVPGEDAGYSLSLWREDLSHVYPGMYRYVLEAAGKSTGAARFITNTYEYSPQMPGSAESTARQTMAIWEQDLKADPAGFFANQPAKPRPRQREPPADLLVLQGSPRPDGNCAILAEWAVEGRQAGSSTRMTSTSTRASGVTNASIPAPASLTMTWTGSSIWSGTLR
jgi:hypothetical protein